MMASVRVEFAKGHGTGNDFVLLPDDAGSLELTAARVRRICDRHLGVGADGVLRVVRTDRVAEVASQAEQAEWFMDYRNADGSIAEMCGNGVRVFAHYLRTTGRLATDHAAVATRAGVMQVSIDPTGYAVGMGQPSQLLGECTVSAGGRVWPAVGVSLPNPHAVAFVDSVAAVGPLLDQPTAAPAATFPDGANFEFVEELAERHVRMRVHERGVGETQSCGTGACAVAWAARRRAGVAAEAATEWQVDVPGGTLWVRESAAGELTLRGPAVIVASGVLADSIWVND